MGEQTICLQISDIQCSLRSRDAEIFPKFKHLYGGFLTGESPDITVGLIVVATTGR
jgi:hypothetical protein